MNARHNLTLKFHVFYGVVTILISFGSSAEASHCEIVEHSEVVQIQDKTFYARINKCVLKPSYIIKSEIVISPDEPQFRNEGRACCCLVDGHVHTYSPDRKLKLKFKRVTKCTCGACS